MKKLNLMLHAGAQAVERAQVAATSTPGATRTWQPIPHGDLVEQVTNTIQNAGLEVFQEAHGLSTDGNRYFGLLHVGYAGEKNEAGDYGLVVGLRNSHDMTFPAGLLVGSQVFVCDNLSFSGEVQLARRHTRFIRRDLPQLVVQAVSRIGDLRGKQDERLLGYKNTVLDQPKAHDLMIQALDAQVIPVTKINHVLEQWRKPAHEEFTAGGWTAWRLFNAFTQALKGNLGLLPKRTEALHGLLDAACGIAA